MEPENYIPISEFEALQRPEVEMVGSKDWTTYLTTEELEEHRVELQSVVDALVYAEYAA